VTASSSLLDRPDDRFWLRAAMVAGGFLAAGVTASSDEGPVLCPFRRCTGGYCPGCGLTRATGQLIRGELRASVATHPVLVLLVAQLLAVLVARARFGPVVGRWLTARLTVIAVANTAALTLVWIVRMTTGAIPAPFAG
jgi:hypothetical protein